MFLIKNCDPPALIVGCVDLHLSLTLWINLKLETCTDMEATGGFVFTRVT